MGKRVREQQNRNQKWWTRRGRYYVFYVIFWSLFGSGIWVVWICFVSDWLAGCNLKWITSLNHGKNYEDTLVHTGFLNKFVASLEKPGEA
jgi:hypothetical protein